MMKVKMKMKIMVLVVVLVWIKCVCSEPCTSNRVPEGTRITITKTIPKTEVTNGSVKWTLVKTNGRPETIVTECNYDSNTNSSAPCTNPVFGEDDYSGEIMEYYGDGQLLQASLTIAYALTTRDRTTWTLKDGTNRVIVQCDLEVYSRCTTKYVAEGSTLVMTRDIHKGDVTNGNLKWTSIDPAGFSIVVTDCYYNNNNNSSSSRCTSPVFSVDVYSSTIATDGRYFYEHKLTIHKVDRLRDQTTWTLYSGQDVIEQCNLDVYSLPSNPVCQDVKVSTDGTTVSKTCTVNNVYPDMECRFKKFSGGIHDIPSKNVDTHRMTTLGILPPRTVYHNYTCTLNLTVRDEGWYRIRLRAMLVSWNTEIAYRASNRHHFYIRTPRVELTDCPSRQEYIHKDAITRTCECRLKTGGTIIPGVPQWRDESGRVMGEGGLLPLIYYPDDPSPSYECRSVSSLGEGWPVTYRPKFAYGPDAIDISFDLAGAGEVLNECGGRSPFRTYCDIDKDNVSVEPVTTLTASARCFIRRLSINMNKRDFYRHAFSVTPERGGNLRLTCLSINPNLRDLTANTSKNITVQEPPRHIPRMAVDDGRVLHKGVVTVTEGDNVKVTCRVTGGYPSVSNVTTTCAGVKNVSDGVESTQTISVKKDDNAQTCTCDAEHVTGCYWKTSEFTLNVLYTPTLIEFKANSKSTELTVSAGDTVTFVCNAEGNPRPSVSVRGQRWDGVVTLQDTPSGVYGIESSGTKEMSCMDTDVYTCMADNGVGGGMSKNVSVFVECVPELPYWLPSRIQDIGTSNTGSLQIQIPILGFPLPELCSLKKLSNTEEEIEADLYNVTYIPDQPPKGVVVLTMVGLTRVDSGQYVLTIDNGIKDGLDYVFTVNVTDTTGHNNIVMSNEDSEENNNNNDIILIGVAAGLGTAVVFIVVTAVLCLLLTQVTKGRLLIQQVHDQLNHDKQQLEQQLRELQEANLEKSIYEEIGVEDGYHCIGTQAIDESKTMLEKGTSDPRLEGITTPYSTFPWVRKPVPNYPPPGIETSGSPCVNSRADFPELRVKTPYSHVTSFKAPVTVTSHKSEVTGDSALHMKHESALHMKHESALHTKHDSALYMKYDPTSAEANESHSVYELSDRSPFLDKVLVAAADTHPSSSSLPKEVIKSDPYVNVTTLKRLDYNI